MTLTTTINNLLASVANLPYQLQPQQGGGGAGTNNNTVAPPDTGSAINNLVNSDLWQNIIVPISVGLAVLVLIFGAYRVITKLVSANATGAFKTIISTLLVAALLFRLDLVFALIGLAGSLVGGIVSALGDLTGGGGTTGGG